MKSVFKFFFASWFSKYIAILIVFTLFISAFSSYMGFVADHRRNLSTENFSDLGSVYNYDLKQSAPELKGIDRNSVNYEIYNLNPAKLASYLNNTNLSSTNGLVIINSDFVKKGLVYQPAFKIEFSSEYILKNSSKDNSIIAFNFPFPANTNGQEISNAKLLIDGVEQKDTKAKISLSNGSVDGLHWEGKVPGNGQIKVKVSYNTVGLSNFKYEGFENTKGAQNFDFKVQINGTRLYNVNAGLSLDKREFGKNSTTLIWSKTALYSRPNINVSVGDKLNPSVQVARVYNTMTPIYVIFIVSLIFLAHKFSKGLKVVDVALLSILFTVFFPFFHYLTSFTIDPTVDIFSNINVSTYSMSLYTAFAVAFLVIGSIAIYFLIRTNGVKFALKLGLPLLILAIGYFPLVATLPEYFGLLTLIGIIFMMMIVMQVRISLEKKSLAVA